METEAVVIPEFPFGAVHHADFLKQSPPHDLEEYRAFMRREISAMARLGMNSYNINFAWFDIEADDGVYDWGRTDTMMELSKEFGLAPLGWVFGELTPRWLVKQHPETAAVAATGYSGPSHSWGSHLAREYEKRWIQAVVTRYGDAIAAWDIGVESGLFWLENQDSREPAARLWDYNPDVVSGFPGWLEQKYGTIAALNLVYRDHYQTFTEVEAPNSRYISEQFMLINQANWLDWRLYMCDVLTGYIHFKADCVRELVPDAIISDQTCSLDPAFNSQDLWPINESMDVIGTSVFVYNSPGEHLRGSYTHDYMRSSAKGKPYWLWELRCGPNAWGINGWGVPVSANDAARYTWQSIAYEVKSIQYWNWRPHVGGVEIGGHGMTRRDGSLTPRAERIGQIARAVAADSRWYAALARPKASIAMLDAKLPRIVAAGEGSDALVTDAHFGAYTLFRSRGYEVDIVHEQEVATGGLDDYRLLVVPLGYAMARSTADKIKAWVDAGGTLLAGMFCATKDEYGFGQAHNPGLGLHDVFGADEYEMTLCYAEDDERRPGNSSSLDNYMGLPVTGQPKITLVDKVFEGGQAEVGSHFLGAKLLSRLETLGGRVIATDSTGAPVVTFNQFGSGRAVLVGTILARPDQYIDDALARIATDLATLSGIAATVHVRSDVDGTEVEANVLYGPDGRRLLVVMNPGPTCQLRIEWAGEPAGHISDAETGEKLSGSKDIGQNHLDVLLTQGDARGYILDVA